MGTAAGREEGDLIRSLIGLKADPNGRMEGGATALYVAAQEGALSALQELPALLHP
jgi:hypothetical protein